jgi:hypothetical protein
MNSFIIALVVVVINSTSSYWYNLDKTPKETMFACQTEIKDQKMQAETLRNMQRAFSNVGQVAGIRLSCIKEDRVEEFRQFMIEKNTANMVALQQPTPPTPPTTSTD